MECFADKEIDGRIFLNASNELWIGLGLSGLAVLTIDLARKTVRLLFINGAYMLFLHNLVVD